MEIWWADRESFRWSFPGDRIAYSVNYVLMNRFFVQHECGSFGKPGILSRGNFTCCCFGNNIVLIVWTTCSASSEQLGKLQSCTLASGVCYNYRVCIYTHVASSCLWYVADVASLVSYIVYLCRLYDISLTHYVAHLGPVSLFQFSLFNYKTQHPVS